MLEPLASLTVDCRMIRQSGIGRCIQGVLPALVKSGEFNIRCLCSPGGIDDFSWHANVEVLTTHSRPFWPGEHWELPWRMTATDIYWAPQFCLPWGTAWRAKRIVATIHDLYHLSEIATIGRLQKKYMKFLVAHAGRVAHRIVTVSQFTRNELLRLTAVPMAKITVIPNGIGSDFAKGFEFVKIPDRYILYVGNVKPHKNLANALAAFRLVSAVNPGLKFYIVGRRDGFFTGCPQFRQWIFGLEDSVVFTGPVDDGQLKNLYANTTLLIFPSRYEGFGYPPLEAMSFNIPTACSRAASIPEVCGNAAVYFDPDDVADMADKIGRILSGELKISRSNMTARLELFPLEQTAARYLRLFQEEAAMALKTSS